jgi:hypothetical protein
MNITNTYQIKLAAVPQVVDRSNIVINSKYYSRLSSKIILMQINILNI